MFSTANVSRYTVYSCLIKHTETTSYHIFAELNLKESTQESNFFVPSANELSTLSDDSTSKSLDETVQTNKPIGTEEQIVTFTDSESIPKTWDLFTLLDTGGQPEFINMLPAINSSTAITFVVLNISSGKQCLHDSVIAQYKCEGYNYSTEMFLNIKYKIYQYASVKMSVIFSHSCCNEER